MPYYAAVNWSFSAFRVNSTHQFPVLRRSYNVIYGSGVNYGNTDLPFTSHQTDNWPVSCCYDRRRGKNTVMPVYMFWCRRMENRTRFISDAVFDIWIRVKILAVVKLCLLSCPHICSNATSSGLGITKCHQRWYLRFFFFQQNVMTIQSLRFFWGKKKNLHLPHLCLHFQFAYQRNPIGTCFAYLHLISNFKWTCQKWSSFLFWMCEDYLACIISASTCNIAKKQNKLISNNTRGTFYIAFH